MPNELNIAIFIVQEIDVAFTGMSKKVLFTLNVNASVRRVKSRIVKKGPAYEAMVSSLLTLNPFLLRQI